VLLDTTPPVVVIQSPTDGLRTAAGSAVVVGTVTDASPIAHFTLNGVAATLDASGVFTVPKSLALGSNTFVASATDAAGNTGTAQVSVTRGSPPTVTITAPFENDEFQFPRIDVFGTFSGADSVFVNGVQAATVGSTYTARLSIADLGSHKV